MKRIWRIRTTRWRLMGLRMKEKISFFLCSPLDNVICAVSCIEIFLKVWISILVNQSLATPTFPLFGSGSGWLIFSFPFVHLIWLLVTDRSIISSLALVSPTSQPILAILAIISVNWLRVHKPIKPPLSIPNGASGAAVIAVLHLYSVLAQARSRFAPAFRSGTVT